MQDSFTQQYAQLQQYKNTRTVNYEHQLLALVLQHTLQICKAANINNSTTSTHDAAMEEVECVNNTLHTVIHEELTEEQHSLFITMLLALY